MPDKFRQYVQIAVDAPIFGFLTYGVPDEYIGTLTSGWRVMVPLGKRLATGFIVELIRQPETDIGRIKAIADLPDDEAVFTPQLMELCRFVSDYYIAPLGETLSMALPSGIGIGTKQTVFLVSDAPDLQLTPTQQRIVSLIRNKPMELSKIGEKIGRKGALYHLRKLEQMGIIGRQYDYKSKSPPRTVQIASPAADISKKLPEELSDRAPKQAAILRYLLANGPTVAPHLRKMFGSAAVRTLEDKGFIVMHNHEVLRRSEGWLTPRNRIEQLTNSQEKVIDTINRALASNNITPFLLHGVTGSGKTLVYLEAAQAVRKSGKGVLVLVPEVALTPQMWGSLRDYFGEEVAVLHSYLSPGERADSWRKLRRGEVNIALGARSAVFAPVKDLGLIVVDEEHEQSYKQGRAPFYNARDVAIMRGKIEHAPVILGSATPSVESYYNAETGKYRLLELPERVPGTQLPKVETVDLRKLRGFEKIFSPVVSERILRCSGRGEQTILLLNRRGFSTSLQCRKCAYVPKCPNCDLTLTYHRVGDEMRCHWCDYATPAPDTCPQCNADGFKHRGKGTQKIELELYNLVEPELVHRIDSDAISHRGALTKILERFTASPGSILVGTQMVAKGHDFPNVTLVVVIDADIGLSMPDFRSHERTFQLLAQVAGRAGRGEQHGNVVIQTRHPDEPAVRFALEHDYKSFFNKTIPHRQILGYPPFARLVRIIAHSKNSQAAERALRTILRSIIDEKIPSAKPLLPTKPPLAKLRREYRWHLMIKTVDIKPLLPFLRRVANAKFKGVKIRIDVDPYDMM